jgi:hypothetical protein
MAVVVVSAEIMKRSQNRHAAENSGDQQSGQPSAFGKMKCFHDYFPVAGRLSSV